MRSNNNNQNVENINVKTNVPQQLAALSNSFLYNQSIYSAYGSTTIRNSKGFTFRTGLRAELAAADYLLQPVGQPAAVKQFVNPYLHVFPNLSVSKRVHNKYVIGLSL